MKRLIAMALFLGAGAVSAATLMSHYVEGSTRYCLYSDGSTITVPDYSQCPRSVNQ